MTRGSYSKRQGRSAKAYGDQRENDRRGGVRNVSLPIPECLFRRTGVRVDADIITKFTIGEGKRGEPVDKPFTAGPTASGNVCTCVKLAGKHLLTGNRNGRKLF